MQSRVQVISNNRGEREIGFPWLQGQQDWKLVVFGQIRYSVTVGSSSGQSQLDPESGQLSILNPVFFSSASECVQNM